MASPVSRAEAQKRVDRIRAFEDELRALAHEAGVTLSPEQQAAIAAHHAALLAQYAAQFDVAVTARERRFSSGMQAAALAAASALAASLVLFFLNVWGGLSTTMQVTVVVSAPFLLIAAAEASGRARRSGPLPSIFATLAFAAFVLDLGALGWIFALTPTPEALLAYGVVAVALAYAYDARLLVAAGALCLGAWLGAMLVRLTGAWWQTFPERPESFLLAAWGVWAWAAVPHRSRDGFPPVLRALAVGGTGLAFLVLGSVGDLSWIPADGRALEVTYQVVGFLLSATVAWLGIRRDWPEVLGAAGVWFGLTVLVKYVDWWWDWMPKYAFFLVLGLTALLVVFVIRRARTYARRLA